MQRLHTRTLQKRHILSLFVLTFLLSFPLLNSGILPVTTIHAATTGKFAPGVLNTKITPLPPKQPLIALTFDDGPYPIYMQQTLDVLANYGVPATFFVIGKFMVDNPQMVLRAYNEGHAIGNHTYNHVELTRLSLAEVESQIVNTQNMVRQETGFTPVLFRPPFGATNPVINNRAAQLGLTTVLWNIDTLDWSMPGVDSIVNTVLNQARDGSIILLHCGNGDRSQTVAALPAIIEGLWARGFRLVTLPQLFEAGYYTQPTTIVPAMAVG